MSRIVIGGLEDKRLLGASEAFLDDGHEIVAYCDVAPVPETVSKGRNVVPIEQLKSVQFDYLVFASFDAAKQSAITKRLRAAGCSQPTLIERIFLPKAPERTQEDKVRLIDRSEGEYHGVIMGLSHALTGIDKSKLAKRFFELSWRGQDMYYNLQLFRYAVEHGKFTDIKEAWLVFPHYYFDYDQSQSFQQYRSGQLFGVHRLNDWHNVDVIRNAKLRAQAHDLITQWRLFGRKFADFHKYKNPIKNMKVYQVPDGQGELPKGFWTDRPATVESNRAVFRELIKLLRERHVLPTLILPPLFVKGLNADNVKQLDLIGRRFRTVMTEEVRKTGGIIRFGDLTALFADRRECFRDTEHLNYIGAGAFAEYLNQKHLTD